MNLTALRTCTICDKYNDYSLHGSTVYTELRLQQIAPSRHGECEKEEKRLAQITHFSTFVHPPQRQAVVPTFDPTECQLAGVQIWQVKPFSPAAHAWSRISWNPEGYLLPSIPRLIQVAYRPHVEHFRAFMPGNNPIWPQHSFNHPTAYCLPNT